MARKGRAGVEQLGWFQPQPEVACPMCERVIPESQRDDHHLVPKAKGGRETQSMHRICHRQIHALFSETELARQYSTAEALLEHPEVRKFVAWVKRKPPEFCESVKLSNRRR